MRVECSSRENDISFRHFGTKSCYYLTRVLLRAFTRAAFFSRWSVAVSCWSYPNHVATARQCNAARFGCYVDPENERGCKQIEAYGSQSVLLNLALWYQIQYF